MEPKEMLALAQALNRATKKTNDESIRRLDEAKAFYKKAGEVLDKNKVLLAQVKTLLDRVKAR